MKSFNVLVVRDAVPDVGERQRIEKGRQGVSYIGHLSDLWRYFVLSRYDYFVVEFEDGRPVVFVPSSNVVGVFE